MKSGYGFAFLLWLGGIMIGISIGLLIGQSCG